MGFKARHTYELVLPDRLAGLEVLVRGRSMGEFFQPRDMSWEDKPAVTDEEKAEKAAKYRALYAEFVADVVSWNLEDEEDVPLPVTVEAVIGADEEVMLAVVWAWVSRRVKLPAPLEPGSTSGEPSLVAQIPMETLSDSQAS